MATATSLFPGSFKRPLQTSPNSPEVKRTSRHVLIAEMVHAFKDKGLKLVFN